MKIVVLLGGNSPERDVSLVSGAEIAGQLVRDGHDVVSLDPAAYPTGHEMISAVKAESPALVFIALHGGEGENGVVQAQLTGSRIPFTGSGFKASAVAMDKLLTKLMASTAGIPVPAHTVLELDKFENGAYRDGGEYFDRLAGRESEQTLVLKPADAGSSVGVHIVSDTSEWDEALADAFRYSRLVLAEQYIAGRELTVTVLDGEALPVVEIRPRQGFYDYRNKYNKGNTDYDAPAALEPGEKRRIQVKAVRMWRIVNCSGYARIDFRYDGKTFYFLEVNTLPGMTPLSLTPMAAQAAGIDFGGLLDRIIRSALQAFKNTNREHL